MDGLDVPNDPFANGGTLANLNNSGAAAVDDNPPDPFANDGTLAQLNNGNSPASVDSGPTQATGQQTNLFGQNFPGNFSAGLANLARGLAQPAAPSSSPQSFLNSLGIGGANSAISGTTLVVIFAAVAGYFLLLRR